MRTLYLDCFAGVSGDMFVGALLDCGVSIDALRAGLSKLQLPGYEVSTATVDRCGIAATKFEVHVAGHFRSNETRAHNHEDQGGGHTHEEAGSHAHEHRSLSSIRELIESSGLTPGVKQRAVRIFERLGEAEAKVHNVAIETVHFHEVGAIDSIIDIVGASICLEILNIERVRSSPLHVGSGTFECAHGTYPVPGPATAELLTGIPFHSGSIEGELVTPTGAAIVASIAESFGPLEGMLVEKTGYGGGTRQYEAFPNVLRVFLGRAIDDSSPTQVSVVETNIDDLNPQVFGYLLDQLLEAGALDVFYTPVHMKKNRPGVLLTVLTRPQDRNAICEIIFRETTTLGVRHRLENREVLLRSHVAVATEYGEVRIKVAKDRNDRLVNCSPEFEDCLAAARKSGVALREVQTAAMTAFRSLS